MGARPNFTYPAYTRHKATGQAVVRLNGRDFYLGDFESPESRVKYDRLIAEWLAAGRRVPDAGQTVNYRKADGTPTGEADNIKRALTALKWLYGDTAAEDFGPLTLKACRE